MEDLSDLSLEELRHHYTRALENAHRYAMEIEVRMHSLGGTEQKDS